MNYVESFTFESKHEGPSILCLGAIHGNEPCGAEAIFKLINELRHKSLTIEKGKITFIPICNPEAYKSKKRYIDINLNRLFGFENAPVSYEKNLAHEISQYIPQYDYILDLHSNHAQGDAFIFLDTYNQKEINFAYSLGIKTIVTGWPEMYQNKDYTTSGYAHAYGKVSLTVECGQHGDPRSPIVGYKTLRNALNYLGIIKNGVNKECQNHQIIKAEKIFYKEKEGLLSKDWGHMNYIKKGEIIAEYSDSDIVQTPQDIYILLPFKDAQIGDEWFYFGVTTNEKI